MESGKKLPPPQSAFEVDSAEIAKKRTSYYDKWRSVSVAETEKVKDEEEEEKINAAKKLGLSNATPKSEAERIDMEKRAALREAKKAWEGKKVVEEGQIFNLKDLQGCAEVVLDRAEILHRPVLRVANCKQTKIVFSEDMGSLIKVFVEDCEDCEIVYRCNMITQHLEISHCTRIDLKIQRPVHTIQLDLVDTMRVYYDQNCLLEGDRLYHAGVKALEVHHFDLEHVKHDYTDSELHGPGDNGVPVPNEERQFVTHLKNLTLVTERVRRASGMMPMTDEELSKVAGTVEIDTAHIRQAKEKRTAGNEAFANGEFMQSGVFYTQAMQLAPGDEELLTVCLSNRAACNLKLGRLEEALEDANACVAMKPSFTKGWFRKGIALHAMKQYGPAIEALSKAESLDSKNKQIKEALGFAKVLLQKELREQAEKYKS